MALTDFGALTDLQKKAWSLQVSKQGRDDNFWLSNGFIGKNTSDITTPITRVTELTPTERGTAAVLPLVADLTGGGVVGDNQLEGQEATLLTDAQTIQIDQLRNGVRSKGRMSEQATVLRFRVQARDALAFWLADLIDELMFMVAAGRSFALNFDGSARATSQITQLAFAADVVAASGNRVMFPNGQTSEATLTTNDVMVWNLIIQAKAFAKRKRIRPIRAGGKGYYVLVLSTEQCRDLEQSTDYKTLTAQAMPRGTDNPLFQNAKKIVGDVVVYDHQKAFNTLGLTAGNKWGAGGTVNGAQAMLIGAQALGFAQLSDGTPGWSESDNTDYGNRPAIGIGRIIGMLKPQFKSRYDNQSKEDFGIVTIKTAAASS